MRENAVDALAILHRWRGLDPTTLRFHKEDPKTTHKECPGKHVDKRDMIDRITARMAGSGDGEHVPSDNYLDLGAAFGANVRMLAPTDGAPVSVEDFRTKASAGEYDGDRSETSGLAGTKKRYADGKVIIEATETLTATRNGKNPGSKAVTERRVTVGTVTNVEQSGYCWGDRVLPAAVLLTSTDSFPAVAAAYQESEVLKGIATQFGKSDPTDQGTGGEAFGTVQTNSDVFGASLKGTVLASLGLATRRGKDRYTVKPEAKAAPVEVRFPETKNFARVPLVDLGPGDGREADIDLTLALDKVRHRRQSGGRVPSLESGVTPFGRGGRGPDRSSTITQFAALGCPELSAHEAFAGSSRVINDLADRFRGGRYAIGINKTLGATVKHDG